MALGYIGVLTIRLEMPWVSNLKEKRALVRPVVVTLAAGCFLALGDILHLLESPAWAVVSVVSHWSSALSRLRRP